MSADFDLVGKTITGVIATTDHHVGKRKIWLLQFSDGTHVEFVSPKAKKALRRYANKPKNVTPPSANEVSQLCLNVA